MTIERNEAIDALSSALLSRYCLGISEVKDLPDAMLRYYTEEYEAAADGPATPLSSFAEIVEALKHDENAEIPEKTKGDVVRKWADALAHMEGLV